MRFFNLDIVSVKKQEKYEADRFKEYVCAIHDIVTTIIDTMSEFNLSDDEIVTRTFFQVQNLKALAVLYEENKFARPFTTINLIQTVDRVNNKMGMFQHMLIRYKSIRNKVVPHLQEQILDESDDDEEYIEQANAGIAQGLQQMEQSLQHQASLIIRDLIAVDATIRYDFFRITSGVDIVRSHRDLCKRFRIGKAKYTIEIMHDRPCSKEG